MIKLTFLPLSNRLLPPDPLPLLHPARPLLTQNTRQRTQSTQKEPRTELQALEGGAVVLFCGSHVGSCC